MYTVTWLRTAEDQLAAIWLTAVDQAAVAAAQAEIDRRLSVAPDVHGVHRSEGLYVIVIPPLAACYSIDPTARSVEVSDVYRSRR